MNLCRKLPAGALALFVVLTVTLPAGAQDLMQIRAESLEGAFNDVQTGARAAGVSLEREALVAKMLGLTGLNDLSFLDWKRPAVMAMPMAGLPLQQKGLVAVVPVSDPVAALDALATRFAGHEAAEDVHTFSTEAGPALFVRVDGGRLVVGGTRDLVVQFDPSVALDGGERAPGNLSMHFFLERVAPMVQQSLSMMRQQVSVAIQADASRQSLPLDPSAVASLLDVYFGVAQKVLGNVSAIQLSLELSGGHAILHERFLPKPGSTFAGLVEAQKPGFPPIARLVDPAAAMVVVGNMETTPAFDAAAGEVIDGYVTAMARVLDGFLQQDAPPVEGQEPAPSLQAMLPQVLENIHQTLACYRSDSAASVDFIPGEGFSMVQIQGWNDTEACRALPQQDRELFADVFSRVPRLADFVSVDLGEGGGTPGGTLTVHLDTVLDAMGSQDPEARKVMQGIYGDTFEVRWAYVDDLVVSAVGATGTQRMGRILEGHGPSSGKGVTPAEFLPLEAGSGVFFRVDLGRLLQGIAGSLPEHVRTEGHLDAIAAALSGSTGRIPLGFRFDSSSVAFEAAVPLETIEAIAGLAGTGPAQEEQEQHGGPTHRHP